MADNCERDDEGTSEGMEHRILSNPPTVVSRHRCMTHEDMFVIYYCENHQIDCCVMCTEDHEQCVLLNLEDIQHESSVFSERIQYVVDSSKQNPDGLNLYLNRIESHIQYGETKVRSCFDRIRANVDKAEKETLKKLEELRADEIKLVTSFMNEHSSLKELLEQIKEEGSRLCGHTMGARETTLPSMCSVKSKDAVEFNKRHEDTIAFIEKRLNDVHETTKKINADFITRDDNMLHQIMKNLRDVVKMSPLHVDLPVSTQGPLIKYKEIPCDGEIWDITMLPGGTEELLLVTREDNSLKRLNTSGTVLLSANLSDRPMCLCVYANTVAVTFIDKSLIGVYNMTDFTDISQIQLSGGCSGICRIDNTFVVSFWDDGVVRKIDDNGGVISSSGKHFSNPVHLMISDYHKSILVSDDGNNRVVAMKTDLKQILFTMSHKDLTRPMGICTGTENRIYVCSHMGHCVLEFTKDGKYVFTHHTTLGEGLPLSLSYDKGKGTLAVSEWISGDEDKIVLYRHPGSVELGCLS